MLSRLTDAIEKADVSGYSILPVFGGSGRSGAWTREDNIGRGDGMDSHRQLRYVTENETGRKETPN